MIILLVDKLPNNEKLLLSVTSDKTMRYLPPVNGAQPCRTKNSFLKTIWVSPAFLIHDKETVSNQKKETLQKPTGRIEGVLSEAGKIILLLYGRDSECDSLYRGCPTPSDDPTS